MIFDILIAVIVGSFALLCAAISIYASSTILFATARAYAAHKKSQGGA